MEDSEGSPSTTPDGSDIAFSSSNDTPKSRKITFKRSISLNSHLNKSPNPNLQIGEKFSPHSTSSKLSKISSKPYFCNLEVVVTLSHKNATEIILTLIENLDDFGQLVTSKFEVDWIVPIVTILSKVLSSCYRQCKTTILKITATAQFIERLENQVWVLQDHILEMLKRNPLCWNEATKIINNFVFVSESFIGVIPHKLFDSLQNLLETLNLSVIAIEQQKNVEIGEKTQAKITDLILELDTRRAESKNQNPNANKDFRTFSVYPTSEEVLDSNYVLPTSNCSVEGRCNNVEHYLDFQFRSLKENFIAPLRRDIAKCIEDANGSNNDKNLFTIQTYPGVVFRSLVFNFTEMGTILNFPEQEDFQQIFSLRSRCLETGSVVCFTKNNYVTILVGRVITKDCEKQHLLIGFDPDSNYESNVPYTMVGCNILFKPNYYILTALQCISEDNFPMKTYIIDGVSSVESPNYLHSTSIYSIQGTEVKIFGNIWPTADQLKLDPSQYSAFKAALTQKFVMIQGAPGTGKTYLGVQIVKTLLHESNKKIWYNDTPILLVCLSNQSVDQFLEGLISTTDRIIRVGAESKNDNLVNFSLTSVREKNNEDRNVVYGLKTKMQQLIKELKECADSLAQIKSVYGIIKLIQNYKMDKNVNWLWFSSASNDDLLKWLCHGQNSDQDSREISDIINDIKEEQKQSDSGKNSTPELSGKKKTISHKPVHIVIWQKSHIWIQMMEIITQIEEKEMRTRNEMNKKKNLESELKTLWKSYKYFKMKMQHYKLSQPPIKPKSALYDLPQNINHKDRWNLYVYWLNLIEERYLALQYQHRELSQAILEIESIHDLNIMKRAMVLGMTTTTASRLWKTLQTLNCRIVIVEEASEVSESHIVVSLTKQCEHLILLGTHQELRPTATTSSQKFVNKGTSLMERMQRQKIPCHILSVQHRMQTKIEKLLTPHHNPKLENQHSVTKIPAIFGIPSCVFFIHHEHEETEKYNSKTNLYEAKFLINLARYMIQLGYDPKDITILAAYYGQTHVLTDESKNYENELQGLEIYAFDNYQGKECKIILLSLVRNNDVGKIGVLESDKYVNFALSRAREALYMMGNMDLLCQKSEVWPKINDILVEQKCVGNYFPVCCKIDPDHVTKINEPEDFDKIPKGVCNEICGRLLSCGHRCLKSCHILDRDHTTITCTQLPCSKLD